MAKVHRQLFERVGEAGAVILDTPYGFQPNAADISAKAVRYFKESAGRDVGVASLRRAEGAPALEVETAQARVGEAGWVFSGPGSPTYALRQWRLTAFPRLFAGKLSSGGCLVFSSAAALTLGSWTVPVYEIYKAGTDPSWYEGLDLLGPFGLEVAVIPHFDNAEGGTHDTRYCYLGEQRLRLMEDQLPPTGWVLGVDEHTACLFDFDEGTMSVSGLGTVTVRNRGEQTKLPAGAVAGIEELPGLAAATGRGVGERSPKAVTDSSDELRARRSPSPARPGPSPLMSEVATLSEAFDQALASGDPAAATEATLQLETAVHEWSADTFESDELDRARDTLRREVLRLGEAADGGMTDPRDQLAPLVEALLADRRLARDEGRFADADRARSLLEAAGIEVQDTPSGTNWQLRPHPREHG